MLTLLMWHEVEPMGFLTNYCLRLGLQALLVYLSRREALTPIGAVEVLGAFDLAAGRHRLSRHMLSYMLKTNRILFHLAVLVTA